MRRQLTSRRPRRGSEVRDSFLAKTCTDEAGDYPTSGEVVPISLFLDPKFTGGVDASSGQTHASGLSPYQAVVKGGKLPDLGALLTVHSDRRGGFWAVGGVDLVEQDVVVDVYATEDALVQVVKKVWVAVGDETTIEEIIQFFDCEEDSSSSGSSGGGETEAFAIAHNVSKTAGKQTIAWSIPASWFGAGANVNSASLEYYRNDSTWQPIGSGVQSTEWISQDINGGSFNRLEDSNNWDGWNIDANAGNFPSDFDTTNGGLRVRIKIENASGTFTPTSDPVYTAAYDIPAAMNDPANDWTGSDTCDLFHSSDPNKC